MLIERDEMEYSSIGLGIVGTMRDLTRADSSNETVPAVKPNSLVAPVAVHPSLKKMQRVEMIALINN